MQISISQKSTFVSLVPIEFDSLSELGDGNVCIGRRSFHHRVVDKGDYIFCGPILQDAEIRSSHKPYLLGVRLMMAHSKAFEKAHGMATGRANSSNQQPFFGLIRLGASSHFIVLSFQ